MSMSEGCGYMIRFNNNEIESNLFLKYQIYFTRTLMCDKHV